MTTDHRVEAVSGVEITANAFTLMGTPPLLGRTLTARDEQPAEPLVAVIGRARERANRRAREAWSRPALVGDTYGGSPLIHSASCQQLTNSTWPWSGGALEIGLRRPLHVREERLSTRHDACRLLYLSDIHLRNGRSETLCRQILDAVAGCNPDVVLLGGDLVDRSSELGRLSDLVGTLREVASVLAIGGNHDQQLGMNRVRDAVEHGGGQWIQDGTARVTHGERVIAVSGPDAAGPVDGHVRVLCAHNPRIWKTIRDAGYDLVLAGHLHGCQFVACEYRDRLFPGAILYPYCFLSHHRDSTRLVVSRGVSDLLPIRWKCPREVVLCYV